MPPPPTKNVNEIRDLPDQFMFMFLQRTFPTGTIIAYEKVPIVWKRNHRESKTTRPDFYIKTPNGHEFLIEGATSKRRKGKQDPKKWQKRIVRNGAPGRRLYVYYRDNLEAIQKHHPDLKFFNEDGRVNASEAIFGADKV